MKTYDAALREFTLDDAVKLDVAAPVRWVSFFSIVNLLPRFEHVTILIGVFKVI